MKIFITGICGFVGSTLAKTLQDYSPEYKIFGIDNLSRPGSWINKKSLKKRGIEVFFGDIRSPSDINCVPRADWVIDAAANASVLAGVDGKTSSLQLVQNNLYGTINLLEYCKKYQAGFTLISTSRAYSISQLSELKVIEKNGAFCPVADQKFPQGISMRGVSEEYSTMPPVSLYGSTKVTSEHLALEYGSTFDFPVWINRCGVMSGAGQFGQPAQGIFAFWIHSFREKSPLKYIGFGGKGYQVRDCLHPRDLLPLLIKQFKEPITTDKPKITNVSGGIQNSMSLRQLTEWCTDYFGKHPVEETNINRDFDIPWIVLDINQAEKVWQWNPETNIKSVLIEIAEFAKKQPDWLEISTN